MVSATEPNATISAQENATSGIHNAAANRALAESRKRKRGEDAPGQKRLVVRPCPGTLYDKPVTLTPVKLIERAQLPLSFLDPVAGNSVLPSTRLFSAHVDILEHSKTDHGHDSSASNVLITRLEADNTLYAVEKVQHGVYALCKLGNWVKEADIWTIPKSSSAMPYIYALPELKKENGPNWWQAAALDVVPITKAERRESHLPRLSMQRPISVPRPESQNELVPDPFVDFPQHPSIATQPTVDALEVQQERLQTAEEVFRATVQQYLEALYLSKTSLAFFAKGPLSRARAAFISKDNPSMRVGDFAAFLRSILLQLGAMDKKYREKLPEIIKAVPLAGLSDDEEATVAANAQKRTKKKSKPKKIKPGREGMYPGEDEYVTKWWLNERPGSAHGHHTESAEETLKRRLGELRVRESMAQVILVLEILALEASPSFQATTAGDTQNDTQIETQGDAQAAGGKKRKQKKLQDLNVLLDLILDKLCIWQSVEQDETLTKLPKSAREGSSGAAEHSLYKSGPSDKLRSFCIEVIIPFYMSRLPEKAASVNKRLGGPSASSPAKRPAPGSSIARRKLGEAVSKDELARSRRSLQRVATENAHQPHQRQSSLARSASDASVAPSLKREGSEAPSLSSIPLKDTQSSSSRNSLSQFQRFAKREIDLSAMSAANEAKIKKKAHIEQELKEAISTLKKPNRSEAVKEYADSADRRRPQIGNRKSSNARKPAQTVQITATPKRGRKTKDVQHIVQATPNFRASVTAMEDAAPPSSDPVIPSSAIRPPGSVVPGSVLKSTGPGPSRLGRSHAAVEDTPSRGPAKTVSFTDTAQPPISNLASKLQGASSEKARAKPPPPPPAFELPSALPSLGVLRDDGGGLGAAVLSTPTKQRSAPVVETPIKSSPPVAVGDGGHVESGFTPAVKGKARREDVDVDDEPNIYDALGWDDDVDELA